MHFAIKLLISVYVLVMVGCGSMCNTAPDCQYNAYGGMRDRHDRLNGRVGSLFDAAAADPSIVPPEESLPPLNTGEQGEDPEAPGTDDGSVEESELGRELDKQLEKFEKLPEIERSTDDAGGFET